MRALGLDDPPQEIEIDGEPYRRIDIFKHDSWAATALYEGRAGRIVCKFNRRQPAFGVPMRWLGRLLARREAQMLSRFHDLPNVPDPVGPVTIDGACQPNAVAHHYVEGHPLDRHETVPDSFFAELRLAVKSLHSRDVAYVDLHKCENILVGDDGRPYLIDFQISYAALDGRFGKLWPLRILLRVLQQSDEYHLRKHIAHTMEDGLTKAEFLASIERPWWIKAHRRVAKPFRVFRRRLLVWAGVRRGAGMADTEAAPEDAVRRQMAQPPSRAA